MKYELKDSHLLITPALSGLMMFFYSGLNIFPRAPESLLPGTSVFSYLLLALCCICGFQGAYGTSVPFVLPIYDNLPSRAGSSTFYPGGHLLSHTVSRAVPSAVCVLTVVFGMGTGVSHRRIAARYSVFFRMVSQPTARSTPLRFLSRWPFV